MSKDLQKRAAQVGQAIEDDVSSIRDEGMVVVKAPPGAGKTYLLLQLLLKNHKKKRIAVACFTNAQADDICRRSAASHPEINILRYVSQSSPNHMTEVPVITKGNQIPGSPCVVVANTAKWALSSNPEFDYLLVDEAWQIAWSDLMLLRNLAPRIVLIGDPGQIPPVVAIETDRWETSPSAPHRPAPEAFTRPELGIPIHALPGSRRLPADSVDLVRNFYDFDFGAFASPGERFVDCKGDKSPVGKTIAALRNSSIAELLIPTDDAGPPVEVDNELAQAISDLVVYVLDQGATYSDGPSTVSSPRELTPADIGIVATHRAMNTRIYSRLPRRIRNLIKVDTTERWQGLERKLMIAVHPLSSTVAPSGFDLETGRLCVMASRHQSGLILVSRDHIHETIDGYIPSADQPLGQPDVSGAGLHRHRAFLAGLQS